MAIHWSELPSSDLEAVYNPRVATPDPDGRIARLAAASALARESLRTSNVRTAEDVRYGNGELTTLDLYVPGSTGVEQSGPPPLAMFIHGGYWRGLDKSDHSFVAPPLLAAGAAVANVNYDLCPTITLDAMVDQVIAATRFCFDSASNWGVDSTRIVLIGHSAGAHLTARILNQPPDAHGIAANLVAGMVGISGIYEPEVVLHTSVNEQAQIDADCAIRNNCLVHPVQGDTPVAVWAGGLEPDGWIDQTTRYAHAVRRAGIRCENHIVPNTDHFTVLERSMEPDSPEFSIIAELLGLTNEV